MDDIIIRNITPCEVEAAMLYSALGCGVALSDLSAMEKFQNGCILQSWRGDHHFRVRGLRVFYQIIRQ